jgi:hypothetical protein
MSNKRQYHVVSVGGETLVYQKLNKTTGKLKVTKDDSYLVTGNESNAKNYHGNRLFRGQHQPNYKLGIKFTLVAHVNNSKLTRGRAVNNIQVIPIWLDKFGKETKEYLLRMTLAFKHVLHYPA